MAAASGTAEGPDGPHRTTGHASATGRTAGISRSPPDSETTCRQGAALRRKGRGGDLDDDRRGPARALRRGPDEAKINALDEHRRPRDARQPIRRLGTIQIHRRPPSPSSRCALTVHIQANTSPPHPFTSTFRLTRSETRRANDRRLPARPAGRYWDGIDDHTGRNVVALPPEAQSIPTSPSRSSSLTSRSRAAARWRAPQPIEPRPQWATPPGV